jgi:hypothetical protein
MGTWSPGIFGNDTAAEVRDEYRELIRGGSSDASAEGLIIERFAGDIDNPDTGADVWLALAVSEWELGRLSADTSERALEMIGSGQAMARWLDVAPNLQARRRKALAKAEEQLRGPQPARRTLRKPPSTNLNPGDVLAYTTRDGKVLLWRVARLARGRPIMLLLNYAEPQAPSIESARHIADFVFPWRPPRTAAPAAVEVECKRGLDYRDAGYVLLGNIGARAGDAEVEPEADVSWDKYPPDSVIVTKMLKQHQKS